MVVVGEMGMKPRVEIAPLEVEVEINVERGRGRGGGVVHAGGCRRRGDG